MLAAALAVALLAQRPDSAKPLAARRIEAPIRLDGVLDEPAWMQADSLVDFHQREPAEGSAPTQRTVIRVLAGEQGLYVGAWLYDDRPAELVHAHLRRDDTIDEDDFVALLFDSQRDHRSGWVFGTNPNGMQYDAEVDGTENLNGDWNGVWDVRARRTSFGWTAEFFIPWQNLRYPAGATAFGFNVERMMRRRNELVLWHAWHRQQGFIYLQDEGTLLVPGPLPRRERFEGRPYVAATANVATRDIDTTGAYVETAAGGASAKVGFDGKLAVAPTMTLDVTANTDFAQVDADEQVVNLSRFPVFFPEKREFFLESAGIFTFGQVERTSLFNSRRIGLDTAGNVIPIDGGVRLTGRVGRERVGMLALRTGSGENAMDGVLRIQHDVFQRGYIGAMGTYQGGPGIGTDRLAGGLDFQFPLLLNGQNLVPQGFVAVTRNGAGQATASAWRLFLDYPNDWANNFLAISRIESGFDPALGFVLEQGVQRQTGALEFFPRPHCCGIRKLDFKLIEFDVNERLDGTLDHADYEVRPLGAEFDGGGTAELNLQHSNDVPPDSFTIFPGTTLAPRRYGWDRVEAQYESSPARRFVAQLLASTGGFYSGHGKEIGADLSARIEPHVILAVTNNWKIVDLPEGRFTARVHRLRADYAVSPRFNATAFVQWDNESNHLAVNARIHWIPRPGSDAYLVWNTTWPTDLGTGIPWRRPLRGGLAGKLVWYFRR